MVEQSLRKGKVGGSIPPIGSKDMYKNYSRRTAVEERKNKKKALTFIILSIVTIILLFIFGIPLVAKFVSFISDLTKKDTPITINDNTPPAPPRFDDVPDATSKEIFEISGMTEEGATIYIYLNNTENEIVADSYGEFSLSLDLTKGDNIVYAISKDQAGNKSAESEKYVILFDNEKPEITISSPSNNQTFYGSSQKQIEITGSTDPKATLTVNERFITLDDNGNFKYSYSLSDGENILNFKAIDKAENLLEKTVTVTFTP